MHNSDGPVVRARTEGDVIDGVIQIPGPRDTVVRIVFAPDADVEVLVLCKGTIIGPFQDRTVTVVVLPVRRGEESGRGTGEPDWS